MNRTRWLLLLPSLALVAACAGEDTPPTCSPVGFVSCSGNDVVTCAGDPAAASGTPEFVDCTATAGLFCLEPTFGDASCSAPILGELCFGRNTLGCASGDQLLRCVWVSEQPEPGVSGDVGIWRVQTDCTATGRVCTVPSASCSLP